MVVFDRAYNYYHQFALWTQKNVFFVTRLKKNGLQGDRSSEKHQA